MRFEQARAIADAVLYEGYLLYPYRRSSGKNRVRFQFGVLAPPTWVAANVPRDESVAGSVEAAYQQTECLLEAPDDAVLHLRLRFLQLQTKSVETVMPEGGHRPVDSLEVDGTLHLSFDEALPHEYDVVVPLAEAMSGARFAYRVEGCDESSPLLDADGAYVGRVRRRCWPFSCAVDVAAEVAESSFSLTRLRIRASNVCDEVGADVPREVALRHSLLAAHVFAHVSAGGFVSLLDPPAWATTAVAACRNVHTFPVLVGEDGQRDLVVSSPIVLYDYVQVAPESPGDLHDATEIDEILSLRTMTLTEDEKREARATDPRAAAIVDRVDAMPPEILERLHGAVRSIAPAAGPPEPVHEETPWWDPGADESVSPQTDAVVVDGVRIARGSRVRLAPRARGTDVHDMFLRGRTASVEGVLLDVDGSTHLAVTLDDDPGADLNAWYGRYHYFKPEEIDPLTVEDVR